MTSPPPILDKRACETVIVVIVIIVVVIVVIVITVVLVVIALIVIYNSLRPSTNGPARRARDSFDRDRTQQR